MVCRKLLGWLFKMAKILFLGSGSAKDPGFKGVEIGGMSYREHMGQKGIKVIDGIVESCHGCRDRMDCYSQDMQSFVEKGDRVVAVLEGGLTFALPSLQATQVTFPIISVPMDYTSYQAIILPPGHAAIAGVGINVFRGDEKRYSNSGDEQKVKALTLAERILNLENDLVNIPDDAGGDELKVQLRELGIGPYGRKFRGENVLSLAFCSSANNYKTGGFLIRADPDLNPRDLISIDRAEWRHHQEEYNQVPTAEVYGVKNLAIFAAKIISLQKPELRGVIRDIASDKLVSYGGQRNLLEEVRGLGDLR